MRPLGQQHPVGKLGHAQPALRRLDELDERRRRQGQLVLDHQVSLEPPVTLAWARRKVRHTTSCSALGRERFLAPGDAGSPLVRDPGRVVVSALMPR